MNEFFLVGMLMGIPPWGMILKDNRKTGITIQLLGMTMLIANLIVLVWFSN